MDVSLRCSLDFFSGALIKSILGLVKAAASFPPSRVIPGVGFGQAAAFPVFEQEPARWQVLVLGIFCLRALLSCSTFLFQDIPKPAFPSAFPLPGFSLNIKITLSKLGFLKLPRRSVEVRRAV